MKPIGEGATKSILYVIGTGMTLALLLVAIRWGGTRSAWHQVVRLASSREPLILAYYDLLYVTFITGGFIAALLLVPRRPAVQRVGVWLYLMLAILSIVMACINQKALLELGAPITYQWLYYSDFLRGIDAYNAMRELATRTWIKGLVLRCFELLVGSYLLARALGWLTKQVNPRWLVTPLVAGMGFVLVATHATLAKAGSSSAKLQNPVVRLLASAVQRDKNPLLTTLPTSIPPTDFLPLGFRATDEGPVDRAIRERAQNAGIRNLLIVVLESTGAEYVGAYGGVHGVTPNLDRLNQQAIRFTRIYAHVPSTVHTLVSLLLSVYHPHSFRVLTAEYPRVRLRSLSGQLAQRRYRTAFFSAADTRFQQQDTFLRTHGFDKLQDYRSVACVGPVFRVVDEEWSNLDGVPDDCAMNSLLDWTHDQSGTPFFGMLWTNQTHYPYFLTAEPEKLAVRNTDLNRYLNAMRETDRAMGKLVAALERQQLLDSTLIVVVGDHGETFGGHGHYVHGVDLYDEETHVPLMLINRRLFHGEANSTLGGMIDVAPTILNVLGVPAPATWQGSSLFDDSRSGRVYLFSPRSRVLFGYREGNRKFIYDAGANDMELYDLQADPAETRNVASRSPAITSLAQQRLAAWVQYQQRFFTNVLVPEAR